jgi:hypothetical protein
VFLELATFIVRFIYLVENDYPRTLRISRTVDIINAFLCAALAYWGLTLRWRLKVYTLVSDTVRCGLSLV